MLLSASNSWGPNPLCHTIFFFFEYFVVLCKPYDYLLLGVFQTNLCWKIVSIFLSKQSSKLFLEDYIYDLYQNLLRLHSRGSWSWKLLKNVRSFTCHFLNISKFLHSLNYLRGWLFAVFGLIYGFCFSKNHFASNQDFERIDSLKYRETSFFQITVFLTQKPKVKFS